jgi:crotonobetainyl-CoA:carnitine CoA-transferase CaiB-like acyl-CoA transferase
MILPMTLPDGTQVKMPGITPKLSETPGAVRWTGPTLGEHTAEILRDLGLAEPEIRHLRAQQVVA